jgi:hypothetical protein
MPFIVDTTQSPVDTTVVYRAADCAFDSEPRPADCAYALGVNEVELMMDEEESGRYRVVFVTGYCPYWGWRSAKLEHPRHAPRGVLYYVAPGGTLLPGVTVGITSRESRWPIFFDCESGWVCLGPHEIEGVAVEFAPGCVAILRSDQVVAVWLHPPELPEGAKKRGGV